MKLPTVYISPMSREIIAAVLNFKKYGFTATRNQISDNGYVCKDYELLNKNVITTRDHGGLDLEKYLNDAAKGYKILHIDVWKDNFYSSIGKTIHFIEEIYSKFPNILFEIGTEEKVFPYDEHQLSFMLYAIHLSLDEKIFKNIKYIVIQSGAYVFNATNIDFNEKRFEKMIKLCNNYNILSKEHNCDFINLDIMKKRLSRGLSSYNVGPEIIFNQNMEIIKKLGEKKNKYIQEFCYEKHEWERWTDKEELIVPCTLHYYYNELKNILPTSNVIEIFDIIKRIVI